MITYVYSETEGGGKKRRQWTGRAGGRTVRKVAAGHIRWDRAGPGGSSGGKAAGRRGHCRDDVDAGDGDGDDARSGAWSGDNGSSNSAATAAGTKRQKKGDGPDGRGRQQMVAVAKTAAIGRAGRGVGRTVNQQKKAK